jgi:hypothetical protein
VNGGTAQIVDEAPRALIIETAEFVVVKDAPIVAAARLASVGTLASYDRRHLLRQATTIHERFGIVVATPEMILASR